ncbi:hypothetical protein LAUMK42_02943 [Mycobacterium persicum]|uniref:Uncharacterized protein n=1 Tax=Mycobacterium persicum TaxID=1487726 RepID=A0AB38UTT7_9MYCO|nr:hypothetical protein LAUMK42_02943 [Mycobacterium persicum]
MRRLPKMALRSRHTGRCRSAARRLVRRLILQATGSGTFPVAGFARNTFCFAFVGDLLIEPVDDVLQLLGVVQLLSIEFSHERFR